MKHRITEQQLNYITNNLSESIQFDICDCCKYFDFDGIFGDYNCVEKPLYFLVTKNILCKLEMISPQLYLDKINRHFGLEYGDDSAINYDAAKKYAKAMKNGDKFPLPFYRINSPEQEGRHRAIATLQLNCKFIPVVVEEKVTNEQKRDIIKRFKGMSFEEVDKFFKEEYGLYGITQLGYKDLKRHLNDL